MQVEKAKQCLELARNQFNESIDASIRASKECADILYGDTWESSTEKNRAKAVAKVKETREHMKLSAEVFKVVKAYVEAEFNMDDEPITPPGPEDMPGADVSPFLTDKELANSLNS